MNSINNSINGKNILGSIILDGTTYYVDIDKKMYVEDEPGKFELVVDEKTLRNVLDYITPKSKDVKKWER